MSELDEAERADLDAFREVFSAPNGRRAANWDALQGQLEREAAPVRWLRPAAAVAFLAAAAVVIWLAVRPSAAVLGQRDEPSAAPHGLEKDDAGRSVEGRAPRPASRGGTPRSDSPALSPTPAEGVDAGSKAREAAERSAGEPKATPTEKVHEGAGAQGQPAAPAGAPADASDVAAEAALMQEVRDALAEESYAHALELLQEHARRFPRAFMREEASAWKAVALCGSGAAKRGRTAAAAFRLTFPQSPHRASVKRACEDHLE